MTASRDVTKKLPYRCHEVLEFYGSQEEEVNRLEGLQKAFEKVGVAAEMYYTHRENLAYATLVAFLPWTMHGEISKFDPKAFKKWHG